jgi:murein L,D-transpeptidase YcbB/YkuD
VNTGKIKIYKILPIFIGLCFSIQATASQSFETRLHKNVASIDTTLLSKLYQHSGDYLWHKNQKLNSNAYEALTFIENAFQHGLDPERYHASFLREFEPLASQSERKVYDYLLSDGLIKLITDIAEGQLDPDIADPQWTIPQTPFNATTFLNQALTGNDFRRQLKNLSPTSKQYQSLQDAIVRYRQFVNEGGWSQIPESLKIQPGDSHPYVLLIRKRLEFENNLLDAAVTDHPELFSPSLSDAVKRFQIRYSLEADGIFGRATRAAMNVPAEKRLEQIKINLERLRWLPDDLGQRYIMVNLANYRLMAVEGNDVKLDMRVIVGKKQRETPAFTSKMQHIVLNPHWYVPEKLARLDLIPKQQADPDYFRNHKIRIVDAYKGKINEISPDSIDWSTVNGNEFPYFLRQDPGKRNALGRMKFIMPNPWQIYLHDTPGKRLFNKVERNFSSGCIRVEDPLALASFSLSEDYNPKKISAIIASNKKHYAKLAQPLPVYAVYLTVWANGDELIFSPDNYKRDLKMAKFM